MAELRSALIIDDEAHVRVFLHTLLQAAGAGEIREASNGVDGAALYAEWRPAVVLLDLNMQGQTGAETLSQIIATDPNAVVIIVSSQQDKETVVDCQRRGAVGFLLKSSSKDKMLAVLREFFVDNDEAA
jgi:two-component system chemotaxis response regulator CheY